MMLDGINLLAVLAAAIASFVAGAAWYGALGTPWMRAAGLTKEQTRPSALLFAGTFFCQLLMAFVFAGLIYHAGPVTVSNGLLSAALVWVGLIATSLIVNHRYQGRPWSLTLIDGGHWLAVLLVQGAVIGAVG
ncbi:DUF1761 domain-containing protein [Stappia stellulata]|uniref:DUF1761 domain-containing protein n=1 Tax=Stappia stellulata TaxID=71235 RepID=UPI0003F6CD9C|nr:DUF1761 domain-containing protein [Stappia stellulata]